MLGWHKKDASGFLISIDLGLFKPHGTGKARSALSNHQLMQKSCGPLKLTYRLAIISKLLSQ